jgi:hypothetical protein
VEEPTQKLIDIEFSNSLFNVQIHPTKLAQEIEFWPKNAADVQKLGSEKRIRMQLNTVEPKWSNKNKDTFICYSCAEGLPIFDIFDGFIHIFLFIILKNYFYIFDSGERSFYENGISYFGQALSHSIAQFACEKSLQTIMSRVSLLLFF